MFWLVAFRCLGHRIPTPAKRRHAANATIAAGRRYAATKLVAHIARSRRPSEK